MNKKYKIIDIKRYESPYDDGFVVFVLANPVKTNSMGHMFVSEGKNINTEEFVFPYQRQIIDPLMRIARSETIWTPNEDDFVYVEDEIDNTKHQFIHCSLLTDEYDDLSMNSGNRTVNVPNAHYKADQLRDQWISNGWMYDYSLRDYVHSLATGDDVNSFWGWLFDDPSLNSYSYWNLPSEYRTAYEVFLDMF